MNNEIDGMNIVSKMSDDYISIESPAKINLTLEIVGVLPNGYHTVKSIMQPITLSDTVTIGLTKESGIHIECNNKAIPLDYNNLCYKAVEKFFKYTGEEKRGVAIYIDKVIPFEAGLAGGSSNAAATLKAMNHLIGTQLSHKQMEEIGSEIGADVPFCVRGEAVVATGFGEILTNIEPMKAGVFVIIKPKKTGSSTPNAFMEVDSTKIDLNPDHDAVIEGMKTDNIELIGKNISNIFECVVNTDETKIIKNKLMENGAIGAAMSGAGTAVYGIFSDDIIAQRAKEQFNTDEYETFLAYPLY